MAGCKSEGKAEALGIYGRATGHIRTYGCMLQKAAAKKAKKTKEAAARRQAPKDEAKKKKDEAAAKHKKQKDEIAKKVAEKVEKGIQKYKTKHSQGKFSILGCGG